MSCNVPWTSAPFPPYGFLCWPVQMGLFMKAGLCSGLRVRTFDGDPGGGLRPLCFQEQPGSQGPRIQSNFTVKILKGEINLRKQARWVSPAVVFLTVVLHNLLFRVYKQNYRA